MKLSRLLPVLFTEILLATFSPIDTIAAQEIKGPPPAYIYQYPHVYEILDQSLRYLKREKANGHSPGDGGSTAKQNLEVCRRALFCLDYFNRTMTHQQLDQSYGDFSPGGVNATSVATLVEEARQAFVELKIPAPKENEFPTPELPPELKK